MPEPTHPTTKHTPSGQQDTPDLQKTFDDYCQTVESNLFALNFIIKELDEYSLKALAKQYNKAHIKKVLKRPLRQTKAHLQQYLELMGSVPSAPSASPDRQNTTGTPDPQQVFDVYYQEVERDLVAINFIIKEIEEYSLKSLARQYDKTHIKKYLKRPIWQAKDHLQRYLILLESVPNEPPAPEILYNSPEDFPIPEEGFDHVDQLHCLLYRSRAVIHLIENENSFYSSGAAGAVYGMIEQSIQIVEQLEKSRKRQTVTAQEVKS